MHPRRIFLLALLLLALTGAVIYYKNNKKEYIGCPCGDGTSSLMCCGKITPGCVVYPVPTSQCASGSARQCDLMDPGVCYP